MPQVDLESFVSVCGGGGADRKISCETLAEFPGTPPDMPPESLWLSKDEEMDWYDRHVFFERKESTKGNSNSMNLNPSIQPGGLSSNNSSQRFSANLKSRPSILGLPKPQKTCFADVNFRRTCRFHKTSLFLGRSRRDLKPASSMAEPTSPKVSCIGKVRSKTERSRRNRVANATTRTENDARSCRSPWISLFRIFRSGHRRAAATQVTEMPSESSLAAIAVCRFTTVAEPPLIGAAKKLASVRRPALEMMMENEQSPEQQLGKETSCCLATAEPPLLGGVKRFSSGRR